MSAEGFFLLERFEEIGKFVVFGFSEEQAVG